MSGNWDIFAVLGGWFLIIFLLLGLLVWSGAQFADRCREAGGMLITSSVCVEPDTHVLMVRS